MGQFEDQYLEIGTTLPSNPNIYGLGERIHAFRLNPVGRTYTIFNKDQGTPVNLNLYGSHPFYLDVRTGSASASGVLLVNSNAMDVDLEMTSITFKVIGGIIDLFVFKGPSPAQVVAQYV